MFQAQAFDPMKQLRLQQPSTIASAPGGAAQVPYPNRPPAPPAPATGTPGPQPLATNLGEIQKVPAPAAPAPAGPPASASPALYGRGGGTSGEPGSLEAGLRSYITGAMGGSTSRGFIDRAKSELGAGVEGRRAATVNAINDDAIRRGMFRSGIPAEKAAEAGATAQGSFAQGLAGILQGAEQQDIQGRQAAAGTAENLLGANRQWDAQEQARQEAAAARAAAGRPKTFTYVDPDTGESYEMDESWF